MAKSYIETSRPLAGRYEFVWLAAYPLAWLGLFSLASMHWFLPAGLRLGVLWLLPRRLWWKMAVAEWIGIGALAVTQDRFESVPALVLSTVLPWCIYALVLRGIGRHGRDTPAREALPRLLVTAAVAALLVALALTAIDVNDGSGLPGALAPRLIAYAAGDFAGVVIVAPILLALWKQSRPARLPWNALFAHGLVLAPLAIAASLSLMPIPKAPVYPLLLSLLPIFGLAFRFGWRQGAIGLGLLSLGIHLLNSPLADQWEVGQLQLLVTISGCAALLLGVSVETQRNQRNELSETVKALSARSVQLVEAANRIASLQEQERRRIGVELHDQIGQDMTAIATRLRVVERTATDPALRDGLASIGLLVSDAHGHLREVIHQLHPAVLDRFGLARALAEGPIAEMLRDRGIHYSCEVFGDIDHILDSVASALYRICQEAATNCARHGCGGRMHIQLNRFRGEDGSELTLRIEDKAGPLQIDPDRPGRGLQNIRDRAHAIGADYWFDPESGHPRHSLRLHIPAAPGM